MQLLLSHWFYRTQTTGKATERCKVPMIIHTSLLISPNSKKMWYIYPMECCCCCCCCCVTSVVSNSVRPHRRQPSWLPHPWDSPGKNTGVGCHFLLQCMKVRSESEVAQSCPTLSDPMGRNLPGSSIHGIFQARILEWGAIAFSAMECYSVIKKNQTGSFVEMRMDQSWGCQTAWISQKKKNKYHILMHICGIWKKKWYRWFYLQNRDTDEENRCMDIKGEGRVRWTERLGLTHIHYWYYV